MRDSETIAQAKGTEAARPVQRVSTLWWLLSGFWLLVALAFALQMRLLYSTPFLEALQYALVLWLPWSLLTPGVAWLSAACTLEKGVWHKSIWAHLGACVVICVALGFAGYWAGPPPIFRSRSRRSPPRHFHPPPVAGIVLRRATFQLPIFWGVVGVAHALLFYQRAKNRERDAVELKSRLAQARLQALQMQLNPHFLFNTLNSIASLLHEDPQAADEMIGSLSDLLRRTLLAVDQHEVRLREELDLLDHYLAIEQIRFGKRLRVEKQIDPAALDALVPILILQPLVENAIKHGIETRIAPGRVLIGAARSGRDLRLEVSDNGPGMAGAREGRFKEGVGLANSRARLRELYGPEGRFSLRQSPESGLSVEIQIPWRTGTESRPANPGREQA